MCGIVGYIGHKQAQQIILSGLSQLEYRGYDSAGLAVLENNGRIAIRRDVGKLTNLRELVARSPVNGQIGIGHTRWATHGRVNETNAHPHTGSLGRVVLVHNGIVENFTELRAELLAEGITFQTETDTEVIAQLIEFHLSGGLDFEAAVRATFSRLVGSNAIVTMSTDDPRRLICARSGYAGGIVLGLGKDEMFVASDIPAILDYTRDMIFLENQQIASVTASTYRITDLDGQQCKAEIHRIPWDPVSGARGNFKHFMLKEIFDQPQAIIDTLRGRVDFDRGQIQFPELNLSDKLAKKINRIYIVACGSSYYAGLVGKYLIEAMARIPVEVDFGSEFRYYDPVIDDRTVVLGITQSGETADTLAAFDLAKGRGATLWSIVNVIGSQAMRLADGYILMQAGREIGVATTKAFTTSLVDLYLLACLLGHARGTFSQQQTRQAISALAKIPDLVGRTLENDPTYEELAAQFFKADDFLFIGRGINYPIALEGALKLKEISYIHAEGYPAGEMKHGPIALIDEEMPVIAIATQDSLYPKMISQIEQAKARGGTVIALANEGDQVIQAKADHVIRVPQTNPLLAPVTNIVPLQLLSYHIAVRRGCDVDQPRNLAKSVTVE